jgi:hypothetical protein
MGAGAGSEVPAEDSDVDTIDAEVAGERAEDWYGELEAERGAELEAVRSSEGGVVGHIETVTAPPLVSLSEQAPDGADSTAADASDGVTVCHWCREVLPESDSIRFCPFCGSDLRPSPCRECGEAMEARWQFCASCGAGVRD